METGGSAVVATWENRAQIIEIMRSAREMSQELQDLWNKSGGLGRLSQDHTDQLVVAMTSWSVWSIIRSQRSADSSFPLSMITRR